MKLTFKFAIAVSALAMASPLSATVMYEVPDAGQTLVTAQDVAGGTSRITGTVSSDADLFRFYWGGGSFYANTTGSSFDSQLFLFDSAGVGLWGNDDGIAYAGPAYVQDADLDAGYYYIGVSGYDYDPYSSAGRIFQTYPYQTLYGPSNSSPLTYWSGSSYSSGTYWINFQQITSSGAPVGDPNPVGIPAPTTLSLLSLGLVAIGMAGVKRR